MESISSTGKQCISELYNNLTNSNQPHLLDLFEKHLASIVKDIKAKAAENQRLEAALKRASQQHANQVNDLDREVEQQMEKLEAKVRQEEKSLYDKKLSDFEWQLEGKDKEIAAMNKTIEALQSRLDKETNKPNFRQEELENVAQENSYLKSQVTDSQTAVALLRSELAELKSQFVEQSNQLEKEQRTAQASVHEQENLARQLQLLHEANQRLQDINDELRGSLEGKGHSIPERRKSCEVLKLSANLESSPRKKRSDTFPRNATSSRVPRLNEYHGPDHNDNKLNEDSLFSEIHRASTPYKSDYIDEEDDDAYDTMSNSTQTEVQRQIEILEGTNKRLSSSNDELTVAVKFNKIRDTNEEEGKSSKRDVDNEDNDEMDSGELAQLVAMESDLTDVNDLDSEIGKSFSTKVKKISTMTTTTNDSLSASYCTPERMYKLVLAGDAAVGKSSFILRLCKNKFHSNLSATLGVDFQVKNLKIDSKTIALQLWDTAGQERFHSIAKSYFRKVDGALLLYDVTCESSFVNIRDWMSTIEERLQKKVPIMLCGNKCDLRDEYIREGRRVVSTESGQRLAKHYGALFVETSAKDGSHVEEACKELAKVLTSLENEEIQLIGLRLDEKAKKRKKRQCCPS